MGHFYLPSEIFELIGISEPHLSYYKYEGGEREEGRVRGGEGEGEGRGGEKRGKEETECTNRSQPQRDQL